MPDLLDGRYTDMVEAIHDIDSFEDYAHFIIEDVIDGQMGEPYTTVAKKIRNEPGYCISLFRKLNENERMFLKDIIMPLTDRYPGKTLPHIFNANGYILTTNASGSVICSIKRQ
jgi:hypothetical protein